MRSRSPGNPHSRRRVWPRGRAWLLTCVLLVGVAAVQSIAKAPLQAATYAARDEHALYDLQADERHGGHTLTRHVGRTDEQLAERLRLEPQITAASTYTDVLTARRAVAQAIEQSRSRIEPWESRRGERPNLAINYTSRDHSVVGRSLGRGERVARPCDSVLVVLRWLEREQRWIVLTSYPALRRGAR